MLLHKYAQLTRIPELSEHLFSPLTYSGKHFGTRYLFISTDVHHILRMRILNNSGNVSIQLRN